MTTTLTALPLNQRPRERLEAGGPSSLTDVELLAVVLGSGRRGESALDLAARMMVDFGGLVGLARAHPDELRRIAGLGQAKATKVVAAFGLARGLGRSDERPVLREAHDIATAARPWLDGLRRERVAVLVCDSQNRLLNVTVVSEGAADRAMMPTREVLNAVLRRDGRAFALAHNHPSGDVSPSDADVRVTAEIRDAASVVGLRFLDHVVVTEHDWCLVPVGVR